MVRRPRWRGAEGIARPGVRRGCRERGRDRNRRVPKVRLRTAALALAGLMAAAGPTPSSAYQPPVFAAPQGDYHAVISMVEVDDYTSALIMARRIGDPLLEQSVRRSEERRGGKEG